MRDRKSSNSRQQGGMNRGSQRQQSQESNQSRWNSGSESTRKQPQTSRTHRTQQR